MSEKKDITSRTRYLWSCAQVQLGRVWKKHASLKGQLDDHDETVILVSNINPKTAPKTAGQNVARKLGQAFGSLYLHCL
jgi:hypothetical protein